MAVDLITTDEFLAATGQTADSLDPDTGLPQIAWGISAASAAVRTYTDRTFELVADADQSPRSARYLGGLLEIDDCESINSITLVGNQFHAARVLDPSEYYASSVDNPDGVIDTVEFFTLLTPTMSPEMGFERNLDRLGFVPYPIVLSIDAVWGWPEIPENVRQAAMITANFNVVESDPSSISAESIAGYSRSYTNQLYSNQRNPGAISAVYQQIPLKALPLLDPYCRVLV